ncbi:MAG: hypothetical protein IKP34_06825 [Bacteroidales bacterium]|nr:hypothetical protein [Bacteroidales bacterium]
MIDNPNQIKKTVPIRHILKAAFLTLLLSGLHLPASAQWDRSSREIVTVYSSNEQYSATSYPARQLDISSLGKTDVFSAKDSTLLYTIPVNLACGELFISNDGRTILHLLNYDYSPQEEPRHTHSFSLYVDGAVKVQQNLKELIGCNNDSVNCRLYFTLKDFFIPNATSRDTLISDRPVFAINDTVFVYTASRTLLRIHLSTGKIETLPFSYHSESQLRQIPPRQRIETSFKCPSNYVSDGEELIASKLRMTPQGDVTHGAYKYYHLSMLLRIDRDGHATIVKLDNRDSLPEARIRKVIKNTRFDVSDFPEGIDFWYQELFGAMHKRNKLIAKHEGKIEWQNRRAWYERRIVADTIDGVYIPRNIEDCFSQLDSILAFKNRRGIIAQPNRESMSKYHFGLGMWLRNNWGLWSGSRLERYFYARGVYHPDNMSGVILEYYYDYLHGVDSNWRAFDTTLVPPPPPDTATVAIPEYKITDRHLRRILKRVVKGYTLDPEDEETPMEKKSACFLTLYDSDDTSDTKKMELIDEIKEELADDATILPSYSKKTTLSKFNIDNPFTLLDFAQIEFTDDYRSKPFYGYIMYKGRYFYLTQKEIDSRFFKAKNKSRRFWKPAKYDNTIESHPDRTYAFSNGLWYIIWED